MEVNTTQETETELGDRIQKLLYIMEERKIVKEKIQSALKKVALILTGYLLSCVGISIISTICLSVIAIGSITFLEIDNCKLRHKIATRYKNASLKLDEFKEILKDSSPWLSFPDWERADWLNDIVEQLWPFLSNMMLKKVQGKLERKLREKLPSFKFNNIEFGTKPPKIDGIKVYKQDMKKNSIIIDFDMVYDGDGNICCEISNRDIGTIKNFQLSINVRVILKPILPNAPIIGGAQIFFLNAPQLNFELEGISNVPGLNYIIRHKIDELIKKRFVFPHNITKQFTKPMNVEELKLLEPKGVLRVHVFEGRNLVKKDVTGKSDPYMVLNIGAQTYKTEVVPYNLNPQWDFWCEFMVLDCSVQNLDFTVYDKDLNEDDFMGSGVVSIKEVINGKNDQWIKLNSVSHGEVHLRFTWLILSSDVSKLEEISQETKWVLDKEGLSTGLITIFIKSAQNLPRDKLKRKPDAYFIAKLGKNTYKGKVKRHTTDPAWEHGFSLLVPSPNTDVLKISLINKETDESMAEFQYSIGQLMLKPDLRIVDHELENGDGVKLCMSLQLKILSEEFGDDDLEDDISYSVSDNSSTSVSRQISVEDIMTKDDDSIAIQSQSPSRFEYESQNTEPKFSLGDIELTLSYNDLAQKFVVFVHQVRDLPLKDPRHIPDPYVKLQLDGPGFSKLYKTNYVTDNCNPVYEQEFDFLISKSNLYKSKLIVCVKTKKLFSSKNFMGQIEFNFENEQTLEDVSCRRWYQLKPK